MQRAAWLTLSIALLVGLTGCPEEDRLPSEPRDENPDLPARGISAHRGASATHPENTLVAIRAAVDAGAQQIEIDSRVTADGRVVLMHDKTVNDTTNGGGAVADLSFEEIRRLDAGSWFDERFAGERVPSLEEALDAIPRDRWINLDVKGDAEEARAAVRVVAARDQLDRVIFATREGGPLAVRQIAPVAWICDMDRRFTRKRYIEAAAARGADFVQLHWSRGFPDAEEVAHAKRLGLRINYCCTDDLDEVEAALRIGVDFPLTNVAVQALTNPSVRVQPHPVASP